MGRRRFLAVAGASAANTRGRLMSDRWAAGCADAGAWAIVADGISADPNGASAAQAAVDVAGRFLIGSPLLERALLSAADAAAAAVEPWYRETLGGTTLTIAAITSHRLTVVAIGDSPVFLVTGGSLQRITPPAVPGPLQAWVGMSPRTAPWMVSRPYDPHRAGPVVIATDGLQLDGFAPAGPAAPAALSGELLRRRPSRDADDAAVAVIGFTGAGAPSTAHPQLAPTLRMDPTGTGRYSNAR
jgi:hypothetical protein